MLTFSGLREDLVELTTSMCPEVLKRCSHEQFVAQMQSHFLANFANMRWKCSAVVSFRKFAGFFLSVGWRMLLCACLLVHLVLVL